MTQTAKERYAKQPERKARLKELVTEIRKAKKEYRESCKEFSLFWTDYGFRRCVKASDILYNSRVLSIVKDKYRTQWYKMCAKQSNMESLRIEARYLNIIYSLYNGKTMKQIEPKRDEWKYSLDIDSNKRLHIRQAELDSLHYKVNKRLEGHLTQEPEMV